MGASNLLATMFFPKLESCQRWYKALVQACSYYRLEDFYDEQLEMHLGSGSRGTVYKGVNKKQKQEVAIKRIQKDLVQE